ncbi:MAG TPA: FAD-dependent monooxygenase, partial [Burkholderiaceae bacterium]|nr:FAD-dependent monooxygenase [Burkholderiaceae bacterium]
PASVELLTRLKVWPQIDSARVQPVARMRVFGDAGAELEFDAYGAAVERLATIVEESELLRVLAAACAYAGGLRRFESAFVALAPAQRAARVTFADGAAWHAKLVIGADGANSAVRAAAGISAYEQPYGQTAVVANFAAECAHDATAYQWFTDEGVVALLPLPDWDGRPAVSLVWSAPAALAQELLAAAPAALAERVTQRTAATLGTLAPLGAARGFALRRLAAAHLIAPRVALVGDAAHVVHPLAGQGLNLGLGDVSELLRVLGSRESFRDIGDTVLLRRYERARAEPIGLMRFTTDALAKLFGIDDPLARRVRNTGLGLVNRLPPLKRALIRQALG